MKTKILMPAIFTSALLLAACGGSDDGFNNGGSVIGKEHINWSNATDLDSVAFPVANLTHSPDNIVIEAGYIADEIHLLITDPQNEVTGVRCDSGSVKENSDGSVTLDKCKNFNYTKNNQTFSLLEDDSIINGSINHKFDSTISSQDKSIVTLSNLSIDFEEVTISFNGAITSTYTSSLQNNTEVERQDITNFDYQFIDKEQRNKLSKYTLKNYSLTVSESNILNNVVITETSIGNLSGESNGKNFTVNFASTEPFKYSSYPNFYNKEPNVGKLEIVSTANTRNTITIATTNNPTRALYSAYANNLSVSGFPKTVDWDYFE